MTVLFDRSRALTVKSNPLNIITSDGATTSKCVAGPGDGVGVGLGLGVGVAVAVGVGVGVAVGVGVGVVAPGSSSVMVAAVAALPRKGSPYTSSIVRRTLKWLYVVATVAGASHGAAAAV